MSDDIQGRADARFAEALSRTGARDPRDYYRDRLRELRSQSPTAYEEAVRYYRDILLPAVASGSADPLAAWREYGHRIATLTVEGQTVEVDGTGRASPYRAPGSPDHLIVHLPGGRSPGRGLLVSLPPEPTPAQLATFDLLVQGRQKLREE